MITNLYLLFFAIGKAGLLCGLAPAIAIAIFVERYRIVRVGVEFRGERLRPDELEPGQMPGSNPGFVSSFFSVTPTKSERRAA